MKEELPDYLPRTFQRIHLELTNRCNFSCVFCPDSRMTRKRGIMELDLAFSALDQIAEMNLAEKVTFHVMGEPLLHPHFFTILDHAHERGLRVGLTTNGALLRPEIIRQLAERDLFQIDISLQTPDADSFRVTRGARGAFEPYRNRVLDLLAACATSDRLPIFKIRMMTTRFAGKMKQTLGIPDFMGSSAALRRTVLEWTDLVYERLALPYVPRKTLLDRVAKIGIHGWNVIELSPSVFIETYILTDWGNAFAENNVYEANRGYCFGMRDHFAVLYSGDVVLCCIDFDGKTSLGNLRESSLVDILRSTRLERIMKAFHRGELKEPYCRRCLGSSTRIGALIKPVLSVIGLRILKPFLYRKYRLFD